MANPGVVIGVGILPIGLILLGAAVALTVHDRRGARLSLGWPTVKGEIIRVRLEGAPIWLTIVNILICLLNVVAIISGDRTGDTGSDYAPGRYRIDYVYRIGDQTFTRDYRFPSSAWRTKYPIRTEIIVHYNPANPGDHRIPDQKVIKNFTIFAYISGLILALLGGILTPVLLHRT